MFPGENNEYCLVVAKNRIMILGFGLPKDESGAEYIQAAARDSMEMAQEMVGCVVKVTGSAVKVHWAGNNGACDEYENAEGIVGHGHHSIVSIGFPD